MVKLYYIFIVLVLVPQLQAQTFYVDANSTGGPASDLNPGSLAMPWLTAFKAFSTAQPGDTVYFRKGTYRQYWPISARHLAPGTTAQSRLSFCNYPGENPVITSMTLSAPSDWTLYTGAIYSKSLIVQDLNSIAQICQNGVPLKLMTAFNENGGPERLTGPGQWARDVIAGKLYVWSTNGANPAALTTEIGELPFGGLGCVALLPDPCDPSIDGSFVTFNGLTFEGGYSPVIVAAQGVEIKNCTIRNCSGDALVLGAKVPADANDPLSGLRTADAALIQNCQIYNYGRSALNLVAANDANITANFIRHNSIASDARGSAIIISAADSTVIERNEISDLSAAAPVMDFNTSFAISNTIVRNNIIHHVAAPAVLACTGTSNTGFYNNLVYGATVSTALISFKTTLAPDLSSVPNTNCAIKNNIFSANKAAAGSLCQFSINIGSAVAFQAANNAIDPAALVYYNGAGISLAQFAAAGLLSATVTADPAFVNAALLDFHLTASSPCRSAGANLTGLVTGDFDGAARSTVFDIGPYCFSLAKSGAVKKNAAAPNSAPVFAAVVQKTIPQYKALAFIVTASDPDGDALTWSAQNLPAGAAFANGVFTWTPGLRTAGTYDITLTVSDGKLAASQIVRIVVTPVNTAPVFPVIAPKVLSETTALKIALNASDADGDKLVYSASTLPRGAILTAGTFQWTPAYDQAGVYNITFTVSDGKAKTAQILKITVNNRDRAPVFTPCPAQSVARDSVLTFSLNAVDPDGTAVTYRALSLPRGASFSGKIFTWKPDRNQAGTYTITFAATSGSLTTSTIVTIKVK